MMLAAPDIPDPSQSWATIMAGGLAVLAALIAFCGVWLSQRTTKQSTKAQLTASAELERDKHRRDACISTTREALSALTQLQDALVAASDAATLEGETRGALAAASNECALAASMALLLDMQESYLKLLTVSTVARPIYRSPLTVSRTPNGTITR